MEYPLSLFYATTPQGLEDIAALELKELGADVISWGKGRVSFKAPFPFFYRANYLARTIHRIVILLLRAHVRDLDEIYERARSLDWSFIAKEQAFAVRPRRIGAHPFTSQDLGRVVGQAVIDGYFKAYGHRLQVNLEDPDVAINAELYDDELLMGIDTTGDTALSKRGYRLYQHPAPLNPAVASNLVRLSGWDPSRSLLDPMGGSGTILIEAALAGLHIPPGHWRERYAFERLLFFDRKRWEEVREEAEERVERRPLQLFGMEKFEKHVRGAQLNAERAGVVFTIKFLQGDATKDPLPPSDFIVTNPPYGLRIGRRRLMSHLYGELLDNLRRWGQEGTKVLVITGEFHAFEEALLKRGLALLHRREVLLGDLPTKVFSFALT